MYKTIVLEFIEEQCPQLHARLKASRTLLSTAELKASALKRYHQTWMDRLNELNPNREAAQNASEALELALEDLKDDLLCESNPHAHGEATFSLEAAMGFVRQATPPA
jgi:chromosome segregation ATPase